MKNKHAGFTLLELIVAMVIIGVLSAFAIPTYQDYVRRAKITEATGMLSAMRVQLEQYYQDNRNYGSSATGCGNGIGTFTGSAFDFICTNGGASATNQNFTISAIGMPNAGMNGYTFSIDEQNQQKTIAFPDMAGLPLGCWISKPNQTCN